MREPTFAAVAKRYVSQRAICREYEKHVLRIADQAGRISAERINAHLRDRLEKVSTITVRNERTILLQLVKAAYDSGLLKQPVRGVMRIKARRPATKAWTVEQLRLAISRADGLAGRKTRRGAPLDLMLKAWLLVGYESGARFGDVWSFKGDHLEGDVLRWTQAKTGDPIVRHLTPACVQACRRMLAMSPDGTILGWSCGKRQALRHMREHLDACGIGGTSKWLRRSGATHIEIAAPGMAKRHLGHRTPGLAERAYLDWGQIRENAPQTPCLLEVTHD
jgi:integrase